MILLGEIAIETVRAFYAAAPFLLLGPVLASQLDVLVPDATPIAAIPSWR
jgi:hypothetical protein